MKTKLILGLLGFLVFCGSSRAEVVSLEIKNRKPFAGGKAFAASGAYEMISGIVRYAVNPGDHPNIVALDRAPRNRIGKVEFASDFVILTPQKRDQGNHAILYDVNNRGNKLALRFFNFAPGGNDLEKPGAEGDGFLMRRGYTIVWCGWIGELLPGDGRLLLQPPVAGDKDQPIRGLVRHEMSSNTPVESMPLSRRDGHGSYPPTKEGEAKAVLTWRMRETDARVPIPRSQWSLIRQSMAATKDSVPGSLPHVRLKLVGGFRPGYLFELVFEAEGPLVQGLGFVAVADLISFLRYDGSKENPLADMGKSTINRAHAFGVSQSGRFLRHFLYLGSNSDSKGRLVFDGVIPHVAGGGLGYFNHYFAQPNRHNGQHEDHLYPADVFPFTYGLSVDPFTRKKSGILGKNGNKVKVMHTQSAAEYWHRSGSLVHTEWHMGSGEWRDADIPGNVRIYAFGGTQHGPAADPPGRGMADNLNNPGDYRPFLRSLLDALDAWVKDGREPPPSLYPRMDNKTLVHWSQESTGFPALPGIRYPEVIQQPVHADYGPEFSRGVITHEPPRVLGRYKVLVPRSDADGNDLGTLLVPDVAVPLATYTGWNLRKREVGAEAMLASLLGSYIPFPKTRKEKLANGDPRKSIEERYGSFGAYHKQFEIACLRLVRAGYLLQEDADKLLVQRDKVRPLFPGE